MGNDEVGNETLLLQVRSRIEHLLGAAALGLKPTRKGMRRGELALGNHILLQGDAGNRARGRRPDRGNLDVVPAGKRLSQRKKLRGKVIMNKKNFLHGSFAAASDRQC